MSIEQALVGTVRKLAPGQQKKVLEFAESLKPEPKPPLTSMKGLCADLGISISAEEIDEARRETWKNFPREF